MEKQRTTLNCIAGLETKPRVDLLVAIDIKVHLFSFDFAPILILDYSKEIFGAQSNHFRIDSQEFWWKGDV